MNLNVVDYIVVLQLSVAFNEAAEPFGTCLVSALASSTAACLPYLLPAPWTCTTTSKAFSSVHLPSVTVSVFRSCSPHSGDSNPVLHIQPCQPEHTSHHGFERVAHTPSTVWEVCYACPPWCAAGWCYLTLTVTRLSARNYGQDPVAHCRNFLMVTSSNGLQMMTYEGKQICTVKFQGILQLDCFKMYSACHRHACFGECAPAVTAATD